MASTFVVHASRLFSALRQNPHAFNSVTGCTLFAGSDALAQQIEEGGHPDEELALAHSSSAPQVADTTAANGPAQVETGAKATRDAAALNDFDAWRFVSAGVLGVAFGGFVYPFAYAKLDALWKGVTVMTTLKKSLLEIATVGIFVNSVSISTRGLLVGRRGDDVVRHTWREMPTVTVNDARVWLPYNIVAFSVIPIYVRPATTSLMEACWQTYISLCSHNYEGGGAPNSSGADGNCEQQQPLLQAVGRPQSETTSLATAAAVQDT